MAAQQGAAAARRARPGPAIVTALAAVMERTMDDPWLPELHKRAEAFAARPH
jgi:hypothetical protein